ncbi:hypothetical protein EDF74_2319 [Stenotrophomonas rhizophila]|nr:hypothetical protein EDF74_2319 [Stenotrophomonas rhizophila]
MEPADDGLPDAAGADHTWNGSRKVLDRRCSPFPLTMRARCPASTGIEKPMSSATTRCVVMPCAVNVTGMSMRVVACSSSPLRVKLQPCRCAGRSCGAPYRAPRNAVVTACIVAGEARHSSSSTRSRWKPAAVVACAGNAETISRTIAAAVANREEERDDIMRDQRNPVCIVRLLARRRRQAFASHSNNEAGHRPASSSLSLRWSSPHPASPGTTRHTAPAGTPGSTRCRRSGRP